MWVQLFQQRTQSFLSSVNIEVSMNGLLSHSCLIKIELCVLLTRVFIFTSSMLTLLGPCIPLKTFCKWLLCIVAAAVFLYYHSHCLTVFHWFMLICLHLCYQLVVDHQLEAQHSTQIFCQLTIFHSCVLYVGMLTLFVHRVPRSFRSIYESVYALRSFSAY